MSQWKNQNAIWTAGLPIISPTNWFSSFFCQNHSFHLFLPCRMTESVLYKCLFYKKDKSCVSSEFFKIFVFGKYFVLISTNMVFCTYLNFECICSKSKAFLKLKKKYFELLSFTVWILSEFHKKFKIKTLLCVHALWGYNRATHSSFWNIQPEWASLKI
jgi:hypothetical protein